MVLRLQIEGKSGKKWKIRTVVRGKTPSSRSWTDAGSNDLDNWWVWASEEEFIGSVLKEKLCHLSTLFGGWLLIFITS